MKKNFTQIILFSLIISLSSFGILADWYVYNSKRFTLSFPQKPVEEDKKMKTQGGDIQVKTLTYKAQDITEKNLKFYLSVNEIPNTEDGLTKDAEKTFLDAAVSGSIRNHKANLISEKQIKFHEYSGREIKMSMNDGKIIVNMKSYIIRNEYYGLIAYSTKQNDDNSEMDLFFKSFDVSVITAK